MPEKSCTYNVECIACGGVSVALPGKPLWWKAKKHAEKFLDALRVSGETCGCVKPARNPGALFRVLGFNELCEDFDVPCETFTGAVQKFLSISREGMNTVFIKGVSSRVEDRLRMM